MNDVEFLYRRLKQYISEEVRKIINGKSVSLNKETFVEMARINLKEVGSVPFPTNKFDIKIWSNDHNPPHFHVICEGWNILFTIEDGKELEVKNIGNHLSTYNYIVKNIPIWLDMPCKIAPKISNRENAFIQWQQLHEEEL